MAANSHLTLHIVCINTSNEIYTEVYSTPARLGDSTTSATSRWGFKAQQHGADTKLITLRLIEPVAYPDMPVYPFIHFIPYGRRSVIYTANTPFWHDGTCSFHVQTSNLIHKDIAGFLSFDMILSTTKTLPPAPLILVEGTPVISEKTTKTGNSFKEMFPDRYQDMLRLLKDSGSVNVAFEFTIHSCERKVSLWAHRALLDKYPHFQELLGDAYVVPTTVPVEGISLTTFCALLKYLYTEDLDLDIDPSQYLMCDMDHLKNDPPMGPTKTHVLNKSLKEYNAAQFYTTWNVKDKVTWSDLFLAADRFGITKLRKQCLDNLLESVNKDNAMEILFGVGMCFKEEIYDPVMKYVLKNLKGVLSIQTQDPFNRFADHAKCHEVMLELMRQLCSN
ncbi:hypothetical protein BGX31_003057 [Mortierella sp. GBA43]|nr:hypothetical protein BGX31_003057 [Mortierella sp. GBA43]